MKLLLELSNDCQQQENEEKRKLFKPELIK